MDLTVLGPFRTVYSSHMVFQFAEILCFFFILGKILLRDPLDDNVIPIVEELQRRLPPVNAICQGQVEDEEKNNGEKDDVESGEQGNPSLK